MLKKMFKYLLHGQRSCYNQIGDSKHIHQSAMTNTQFKCLVLAVSIAIVAARPAKLKESVQGQPPDVSGTKTKHTEESPAKPRSETFGNLDIKHDKGYPEDTDTNGTGRHASVLFHAYTINGFMGSLTATTTFAFRNAQVNIGGAYDTGSFRFTAPSLGWYFFSYSVLPHEFTNNQIATSLVVNGQSISSASSTWPNTASRSDVVFLQQFDQVYVECPADDDPRFTVSDQYNSFSGFQIGL